VTHPSCPGAALARDLDGKLSGSVAVDAHGTRVAGVAVIATESTESGSQQEFAWTDATGAYTFDVLRPGRYQIDFWYNGQRLTKECVPIPGGALTVIDVALQIAIAQP